MHAYRNLAVERRMFGEHANRIHQVERGVVQRVREDVPLDQRDAFGGDGFSPVWLLCEREHVRRRVDADDRARTLERAEVSAGAATEFERVDWATELVAYALQPRHKAQVRSAI